MGPEIAVHRDVEIRYGYDIRTDKVIAHVTVPQPLRGGSGLPRQVRSEFRRAFPGQKYTLDADTVEDLLDAMKKAINEFLDA